MKNLNMLVRRSLGVVGNAKKIALLMFLATASGHLMAMEAGRADRISTDVSKSDVPTNNEATVNAKQTDAIKSGQIGATAGYIPNLGIMDAYNARFNKPTATADANVADGVQLGDTASYNSNTTMSYLTQRPQVVGEYLGNAAGRVGRAVSNAIGYDSTGGSGWNLSGTKPIARDSNGNQLLLTNEPANEKFNYSADVSSSRVGSNNETTTITERQNNAQVDALSAIRADMIKNGDSADSKTATTNYLKKQNASQLVELLFSSPAKDGNGTPISRPRVWSAITSSMSDSLGVTRAKIANAGTAAGDAINAQVDAINTWGSKQLDSIFGQRGRISDTQLQTRIDQMVKGAGRMFSDLAVQLGLRKPSTAFVSTGVGMAEPNISSPVARRTAVNEFNEGTTGSLDSTFTSVEPTVNPTARLSEQQTQTMTDLTDANTMTAAKKQMPTRLAQRKTTQGTAPTAAANADGVGAPTTGSVVNTPTLDTANQTEESDTASV